ncbi:hypothetical protein WJX84_004114 [Apatococcus fuscideae]|uniref:Uncharacterized protein n=1 Tax=Apatococcus fuscideae TaxID=2026836 RepID=A0AAW1S8N6_9CHLO
MASGTRPGATSLRPSSRQARQGVTRLSGTLCSVRSPAGADPLQQRMQGITDLAAAIEMSLPRNGSRSFDSRSPSPTRGRWQNKQVEERAAFACDLAANHSAMVSIKQLVRSKLTLGSAAFPFSDAAKILDGLAILLEQAPDHVATEAGETLRGLLRQYPQMGPEVADADLISALVIALKHGCEALVPDLQAATMAAMEAALNLLLGIPDSFPAAAAVAAPSLVALFAPKQQLLGIPSIAVETARPAAKALAILAKSEDPEVVDVLLAVGAIPVLTQLASSAFLEVKQSAVAAMAALSEDTASQAMQQAIREAGAVSAATAKLTSTASSVQLSDLLALLTDDVASQAGAQAATRAIGDYTDVQRLMALPPVESGKSDLGRRLEMMYQDCLSSGEDTYVRRHIAFASSLAGQLIAMRHEAQERGVRLLADVTLEELRCDEIVMSKSKDLKAEGVPASSRPVSPTTDTSD